MHQTVNHQIQKIKSFRLLACFVLPLMSFLCLGSTNTIKVFFKNGDVISGSLIEANKTNLTINTQLGIVHAPVEIIDHIIQQDHNTNNLTIETAAACTNESSIDKQLKELTRSYLAGNISPGEYHQKRALLISQLNSLSAHTPKTEKPSNDTNLYPFISNLIESQKNSQNQTSTPLIPSSIPQQKNKSQELATSDKPGTNSINLLQHSESPNKSTNKLAMFFKEIHGYAQIGLDAGFSSKEHKNISGQLRLSYIKNITRNYLDYSVSYGKTENEISANRMDGSLRSELNFGKKVFSYISLSSGYDEIRKIDLYYQIGPGLGYRLLTKSNLTANITIGGSYQEYNYSNMNKQNHIFVDFGQDVTINLFSKLTVVERLSFSPRPEKLSDYKLKLDTSLRYPISNKFFLSAQLIDIYDSRPATGVANNDIQIRSNIGLTF